MSVNLTEIWSQFEKGNLFKSAMGTKGIFEQSKINQRFFIGDQWYGARCGSDRPLVRHNVIKRIGDYKMSQILNQKTQMQFSAEGIPTAEETGELTEYSGELTGQEIGSVMNALNSYYNVTAERVSLDVLASAALKNAFITGTGIIYTYWDSRISTGTFGDSLKSTPISGDISGEILNVEDVVFGDPYCENVQNQPYIIIHSKTDCDTVLREARLYGAGLTELDRIRESASMGKIAVLTKLYKAYKSDGSFDIKCVKVTEKGIVRPEFSTGLRLYPLAVLRWENNRSCAYGESEITHLIPNQIAINRMITANVWSAMTTGLPIMLVNGDTVTESITNDPGQIIKIYGSNEDVAGAVNFVAPVASIKEFDDSINTLINNTLTQSGANEVALGDSKADNATALMTMRDAALMPLQMLKDRYYAFLEENARIWAQFWVAFYGKRQLKLKQKGGFAYLPFDGERYKPLIINTKIDVVKQPAYTEKERLDTLLTLYDKGIINKGELLERIPEGMVPNISAIKTESEENSNDGI